MRVLLSTIGSRGDVQPLVALAVELRALGQEVRLCVPPDFLEWVTGLGFEVTPIGPALRQTTAVRPAVPPTPEERQRLAEDSVATQFTTIADAAKGCDVIVGASALQLAAPSVAEELGIPYVFAAYAPNVLPSPHHAPPPMPGQPADVTDNDELWRWNATSFTALFGAALNSHRTSVGLAPVEDVRGHILTADPWLAADPVLGPWPGEPVCQPGAWILPDDRPLAPELESFLDAGEPPVYFGFGSMRATPDLAKVMVDTARALGRRAVVSRGWAGLSLVDDARDCLAIGEVNQQALFPRVAAVVHHGGAGTTTAAALSRVPQVIVPQMYDQHYWAGRVRDLAIGVAHAPGAPTVDSLTAALADALDLTVPDLVHRDGARVAAQRVVG